MQSLNCDGMLATCYEATAHCTPVAQASAWWDFWVICTLVEEVPFKGVENDRTRYWRQNLDGCERWIRTTLLELTCPPERFMNQYLQRPIVAFTEVRQFWSRLPAGLANTYHSFTVLDALGDFSLLLEKKTSKLEFMFGAGALARNFMMEVRALAVPRNVRRCVEQPRRPLPGNITVLRLLEWLDGPLCRQWEPYSLLESNCQHFTQTLQDFLCDPGAVDWFAVPEEEFQHWSARVKAEPSCFTMAPVKLQRSREFVLGAVMANGQALRFVPRNFKRDWRVVCSSVAQDGLALAYAAEELRRDPEIAMVAVKQNGLALRYCTMPLPEDKNIVRAAVQQNCTALQFADRRMQHDIDVLMTASMQDPLALRFVVT